MIEIKKLNPDLIQDYIAFHERLDFHHAPEWRGCYCHFYHTQENIFPWTNEIINQHKLDVIRNIEDRTMTGFLAYDGNQVIGWMNANDINIYHRIVKELQPYVEGLKVALSICFIVDPLYRKQGVARRLLDHAISFYQNLGYDGMIALPSTDQESKEKHYHGSLHMYLEKGYQEIDRKHDVAIMYRALK